MKILFLIVLLFSVSGFADAKKTKHQTATGKYPCYFVDKPGQPAWDDDAQATFDDKVDTMISDWCEQSRRMQRAQENIDHQKEVSKVTGYMDVTEVNGSASIIVQLRSGVEGAAHAVKEVTGKPITSYECPDRFGD